LEDLHIMEMMTKGKLAKHIADAAWGEIRRQLQYKAEWYERQIKEVLAFVPTSQTCHVCGAIHPEVRSLDVRVWVCPACQTRHDRDGNAAKNIKVMAV
ncbi:putative transposase, partial [Paenibacillus sp. 598K]|uniref:zinc ribbon domain-containing protein n=1 Tax=Paenibacillus sp. 598K TaxID=1117987 RepID=UPI000FFA72F5